MKKKAVIILIIVAVIIVSIKVGTNISNANKPKVEAKAEAQATLVQSLDSLAKNIDSGNDYYLNVATDKTMEWSHTKADKNTLTLAIKSAKAVYNDPKHTQESIDASDSKLNTAESVFMTATVSTRKEESADTTVSTSTHEEVWQYCVDRWSYYDKINGSYSSDKYDTQVFGDAGVNFNITPEVAQATWDKVDKVKTGVTQ